MDNQSNKDKHPHNSRTDFREVDYEFRKRLDSLVPSHLAERVKRILAEREQEGSSDDESRAENE